VKILGIILIVLAVVCFAWPAITFTRREKVFEAGPVQATVKKQETVSFSPMLGVMFLAVGGGLLVASAITKK